MSNFPKRFGFEPDLTKCSGKTIERVELMAMEWGCTWNNAYAVRFTDGSRAFFAGHPGTGIMNPMLDGNTYGAVKTVETSEIFTKREFAEMLEAARARTRQQAQEHEQSERRQYERLAKKFVGGEK
jgi:hypothetical protein